MPLTPVRLQLAQLPGFYWAPHVVAKTLAADFVEIDADTRDAISDELFIADAVNLQLQKRAAQIGGALPTQAGAGVRSSFSTHLPRDNDNDAQMNLAPLTLISRDPIKSHSRFDKVQELLHLQNQKIRTALEDRHSAELLREIACLSLMEQQINTAEHLAFHKAAPRPELVVFHLLQAILLCPSAPLGQELFALLKEFYDQSQGNQILHLSLELGAGTLEAARDAFSLHRKSDLSEDAEKARDVFREFRTEAFPRFLANREAAILARSFPQWSLLPLPDWQAQALHLFFSPLAQDLHQNVAHPFKLELDQLENLTQQSLRDETELQKSFLAKLQQVRAHCLDSEKNAKALDLGLKVLEDLKKAAYKNEALTITDPLEDLIRKMRAQAAKRKSKAR